MTKDEVFSAWAPPGSPWSRWVKPVLFAHVGVGPQGALPASPDYALAREQIVPELAEPGGYRVGAQSGKVAVVVELPGANAVHAGLALAALGFRPVPLFNAYPAVGMSAVVPVWHIVEALQRGAASLAAMPLSDRSPPAFLLDADRRGHPVVNAGAFDNRSVCTRSDFPTGGELVARGIEHVVVLRDAPTRPFARDLADVLLALQQGGTKVYEATLGESREPTSIVVRPPSLFERIGEAFYRWSLSRREDGFGRAHAS